MGPPDVRALRIQLNWYCVGEFFSIAALNRMSWKSTEALALEQSTVGSIFWSLEQMKEMVDELATVGTHSNLGLHGCIAYQRTEELAGSTGGMSEPAVMICGAWASGTRSYILTYSQEKYCTCFIWYHFLMLDVIDRVAKKGITNFWTTMANPNLTWCELIHWARGVEIWKTLPSWLALQSLCYGFQSWCSNTSKIFMLMDS